MKRVKLSWIIFYLMMISLSIINYESDFAKFFFTGHSATYDVVIVRHSPFLVVLFAALAIVLSIFGKFRNLTWINYTTRFAVVFWILSMRTLAYVDTDGSVMSGWSLIRFHTCKSSTDKTIIDEAKKGNCESDIDPILDSRLKNKLKLH